MSLCLTDLFISLLIRLIMFGSQTACLLNVSHLYAAEAFVDLLIVWRLDASDSDDATPAFGMLNAFDVTKDVSKGVRLLMDAYGAHVNHNFRQLPMCTVPLLLTVRSCCKAAATLEIVVGRQKNTLTLSSVLRMSRASDSVPSFGSW